MPVGVGARALAAACLLAAGGGLVACSPTASPPAADRASAAVRGSKSPVAAGYDSAKPAVPATGAYVGAWTRPEVSTPEGRIAAFEALQRGLGGPLDIVHTYRLWNEPLISQTEAVFLERGSKLLLSWAGTDTRSITAGYYDDYIRQQAKAIADARKPVFIRFRWEMDRPNLQSVVWSPQDYIAAWQHTKTIFDEQGATNAAWVWCPLGRGFEAGTAPAYYPGDEWVDWVCTDVYPGPEFQPMRELLAPFLTWAGDHPKPIMIGEFGVPRHDGSEQRVKWLQEAAQTFAEIPLLKAIVYFDANPEDREPDREYKLGDDPPALAEFRRIAATPHFDPELLRKDA